MYEQALQAGHEGIMIKNPDSPYSPGKREKNWLKKKPVMETLDLVVIGAEWVMAEGQVSLVLFHWPAMTLKQADSCL
jgi:ATP-dependent DNA ligase